MVSKKSIREPDLPDVVKGPAQADVFQLLAFHAARERGLDPDAPRGLAEVTETR